MAQRRHDTRTTSQHGGGPARLSAWGLPRRAAPAVSRSGRRSARDGAVFDLLPRDLLAVDADRTCERVRLVGRRGRLMTSPEPAGTVRVFRHGRAPDVRVCPLGVVRTRSADGSTFGGIGSGIEVTPVSLQMLGRTSGTHPGAASGQESFRRPQRKPVGRRPAPIRQPAGPPQPTTTPATRAATTAAAVRATRRVMLVIISGSIGATNVGRSPGMRQPGSGIRLTSPASPRQSSVQGR